MKTGYFPLSHEASALYASGWGWLFLCFFARLSGPGIAFSAGAKLHLTAVIISMPQRSMSGQRRS